MNLKNIFIACAFLVAMPVLAATEAPSSMMPTAEVKCAALQFSKKPDGQCNAAEGVCTIKPVICTKEFAPVCGCNDKTYSNRCVANADGINVSYEGECKKP